MTNDDAFAYLMDADLVRSALPDWPAELGLVLCLVADGTCRTAVFHREESSRALRKAAGLLGRAERSFAVAPAVEGWPSRRVRFSEEQELLNIVAGEPGLVEVATDYAINYRFAREEGLNPETMVAGRPAAERSPAPRAVEGASARPGAIRRRLHLGLVGSEGGRHGVAAPSPGPTLAAVPTGEQVAGQAEARAEVVAAVQAEARTPVQSGGPASGPVLAPVLAPRMPAGFAPVSDVSRAECRFAQGRIGSDGQSIRLTLAPEKVTIRTRPVRVESVGFSPDFWRFCLPREALEGWRERRAAIVDMPLDCFPEALRRIFAARSYHVDVTITAEGVFLAPGMPIAETPATRDPKPRWLTPLRAAAVALVASGAATGGIYATGQGGPDRVTAMPGAVQVAAR